MRALPIRAEDRVVINLILPTETVARIDSLASEEMISRSGWIRRLLVSVTRGAAEKVSA